MGLGRLGDPNITIKRKHLFTLRFENICGNKVIPEHYVKLAARPNWSTEETEINFLNAKTWIPGKTSFETISVTYIDVAAPDSMPLWDWLASVYNFTNPVRMQAASARRNYTGRGILTMFDGCGTPLERWVLADAWPSAVNFGDVAYADSDEATIELTLRYSQIGFTHLCPQYTPVPCCTPCGGGALSV